jgi:dinuclear metal center YbgI/SA1388 family protein
MLSRNEIVRYFNKLLKPEMFKDSTYNGLQVEGAEKVSRAAFAVDASLENFKKCADAGCQMLVVHHGVIWGGLKKLTGSDRSRFAFLLKNDINLYVSHLPLDNHPELGNNAQIMKALNARTLHGIGEAGISGELKKAVPFAKFLVEVKKIFGGEVRPLNFYSGPVKKIAVCSGAIRLSFLADALDAGADTVLTGEGMGESMFRGFAGENGMNVVFAGHTETEKGGIKALMERFAKDHKKKIETVWIG